MKAVKDLCVRLINRKTYEKEEISDMIKVYHEKGRLTDDEYNEIIVLIETVYN